MSTPINLNKVRKERARASRKAQADENAARFGQSKSQKDASKAKADRIARHLDAHKRET
ncbi:DUF4169 domain-containing protein [Roseobacter denitrificans]|uniref:Uncharacterized protein n=1 Tax=Roseobacter denitrificans (strain ATCC 33942 / OCh 114) TaxID=375451 RepID=Q167I5_ROSDO|nr:DUF4169 family protein [Roseobacter denitrificans]ABG31858.1 conserved hypothetical protein [Roseobacter denitrificans OCh 114]AVL51415.1 DUF4169 domain-containing protein [Roseobacter denitrificans]SFG42936.1 protein of unknown function [Roseobacter denitrificans OCh 114]